MKLNEQGWIFDDKGPKLCTWDRANETVCGTHCLHFKLINKSFVQPDGFKMKEYRAELLCAPHKVEIQLEE